MQYIWTVKTVKEFGSESDASKQTVLDRLPDSSNDRKSFSVAEPTRHYSPPNIIFFSSKNSL